MSLEKSIAIILKVVEFSETSCIISAFTRDFGKVSLIAKGARRPKSPFESALDVLALCRLVFIQKPSQGMGILTEAKLERRFRNRKGRLEWLYSAYYIVELLKYLTEEGDINPVLFKLATSTLAKLDCETETNGDRSSHDWIAQTEFAELNWVLLRFEIGLLQSLGQFPLLTQCVGCGRPRRADTAVGFAVAAGGIVCAKCRHSHTRVLDLSAETIAALNLLNSHLSTNLSSELNPQLKPKSATKIETLTDHHHLKNRPKLMLQNPRKLDLKSEWETLNEESENYFVPPSILVEMSPQTIVKVRTILSEFISQMVGREIRMNRFLKPLLSPSQFSSL